MKGQQQTINDRDNKETTGIRKTRRAYQQHLLSHDERHAHANLPHRLQAHRDFLGAGPVMHELVAQVANDWLQPLWRHQIMTGLHAALRTQAPSRVAMLVITKTLDAAALMGNAHAWCAQHVGL